MIELPIFIAASLILIVTPGPDVLYVVARGVAQGRRAGLLSASGVTAGILVHTVFAALGLAVLLQTSALAFLLVKYLGAAYLLYLGIKTIRDKRRYSGIPTDGRMVSRSIGKGSVPRNAAQKAGRYMYLLLRCIGCVPNAGCDVELFY